MPIETYVSMITLNVNGINAWTKRYRLKVKGWEKIFHANGNQKKAEVAILISEKVDFKIKNDQGINQEEDITIANINTANIGTPHYISKH